VKSIKCPLGSADFTVMLQALKIASQYRITLDRAADQTFVARCVEVPGPVTRGLNIEAVVAGLRGLVASEIVALSNSGRRVPAPLRETEGRMGAWMTDLELISELTMAAPSRVERSTPPSALHAIAQWTIDRYRIVLEGSEPDGYVATSPELPEVVGQGRTSMQAAVDLRWRLEERAFSILNANRMPPEPLQDVEARQARGQMKIAVAA
jgi:predicted RNase H-like HicB family nuclease